MRMLLLKYMYMYIDVDLYCVLEVVEADVLEVEEEEDVYVVEEQSPGCKYYTETSETEEGVETQPLICTNDTSTLIQSLTNESIPVNQIIKIIETVSMIFVRSIIAPLPSQVPHVPSTQ